MTTLDPDRSGTARREVAGAPAAGRRRSRRHAEGPAVDERVTPSSARRMPSDRVRRQHRREQRLRRTVILAVAVLVAGTALARWREDPGSVVAAGVGSVTSAERGAGDLAAVTGTPPGDAGDRGLATPGAPSTATTAPTAPTAPSAAAGAAVAPAPAATDSGHADTDDASDQGGALGSASPLAVPSSGTGHLTPVAIPDGPVEETGRTVTYGIDIEDGLPVAPAEFAAVVHTVLVDERGWQTQDGVRFVPVSLSDRAAGAHVDIEVTLASPDLTAQLCAPLDTSVQQVSCWNGSRAVLNLTRWIRGAVTYGDDLTTYRDYLVSHEVGHGLGHAHASCPAPGRPAPVMVQQTKSLEGCTAWPWPTRP